MVIKSPIKILSKIQGYVLSFDFFKLKVRSFFVGECNHLSSQGTFPASFSFQLVFFLMAVLGSTHFPSIGSEDPPPSPPRCRKCENSGKF